MNIDQLTAQIIAAAMKVHTQLGPGLLESAYECCLSHELVQRAFKVERQKEQPVIYDNIKIDCGYRIDLMVDDRVIVEIKAVKGLLPIHHMQLLSYLRLSKKSIGLLINFHEQHLKDGIKRKINDRVEKN